MPKIRVYEIAKQLNVSNKELIEKLPLIGIDVKNHMASIESGEQERVFDYFKKKKVGESLIDENKQVKTNTKETQSNNEQNENKKNSEVNSNKKNDEQGTNKNNDELNKDKTGQPQSQNNQNRNRSGQNRNNNQNRQGGTQGNNQNTNRQGTGQPNQGYNRQGQSGQNYNQNRNRPPQDRTQGQNNTQGYNQNRNTQQGDNQNRSRPPQDRTQGQSNTQGYNQNRTNQQGNNQNRTNQQGNNQNRTNQQGNNQNRNRQDGNRPYNQNRNRPDGNQDNRNRTPRTDQQGENRRPAQGQGDSRPPRNNNNNNQSNFKRNTGGFNQDNKKGPQGEVKKDNKTFTKDSKSNYDNKNKKEYHNKDKSKGTNYYKGKNKENRNVLKEIPKEEKPPVVEKVPEIKVIEVPESITVKSFAEKMNQAPNHLIKFLMKQGIMASLNQEIDFDTVSNVALEFGYLVELEKPEEEEDILEIALGHEEDKEEDKKERPPIVVVMGHVDHGKTSLLDSIRKAKVAVSEAGGITQHIGAYTVSIGGKPITFLDTPGHEAFTAMRMRGAQVTDIAILVVAADDGVMPQTIEAINHAKAAEIDIIVAINKIDKAGANADRVKQELVEYGLVAEDWGGETICVPVSAQTKEGIDNLLEMIILVSEVKELKANPNKKAKGTVVEALLDKGRGSVATVLVQEGTLKIGDPVVVGTAYGKVRAMTDDKGRKVKKAGPSIPVEILGLSEVPLAGDSLHVTNSEKQARQISESFVKKGRIDMLKDSIQKVSLDDLFTQIKQGNVKDLNIVVKADVQGSVEAVKASLERLSNEEVRIRAIHGGVGAITESDVMLASASNAIIIGFNVRPDNSAKKLADDENVDIRLYRVIYGAIEDIQAAIKGMLDPVFEEKITGHAEVRQIFKASNIGNIAGSYITDGKINRNSKIRILRDHIVIYDGTLDTLKRFKDDVKEVNAGYECGLVFTKFNDVKEGDIIEAYVMEEVPR